MIKFFFKLIILAALLWIAFSLGEYSGKHAEKELLQVFLDAYHGKVFDFSGLI